ncbi:MAG: FtsX-like permease family protein, partial [Acidobacteria bacterium]
MKLLLDDIRLAVRLMANSPKFVTVCLFSLVLGIGINSLIFGLVDAVILRPFPFKNPEQTVRIFGAGAGTNRISLDDFELVRQQAQTIRRVVASAKGGVFIRNDEGTQLFLARAVSSGYFEMLNVQPRMGRFPSDAEGTQYPVVISYDLWRRRFGEDPGIVGRTVALIDRKATVVGIAPEGFRGTDRVFNSDVWYPLETWENWTDRQARERSQLTLVAELKQGVTVDECQAELNVLAARLPANSQDREHRRGFRTMSEAAYTGIGDEGKDGRKLAAILLLLPSLVLLIACINVSALFAARFEGRRREFAIRFALGGTRVRLIRQLLIEGLLLSSASVVICLLLGMWAMDALPLLLPDLPFSLDLGLRVDYRVIAFTAFVALLATLVFGLGPTLRFSKTDLTAVMKNAKLGTGLSTRLFGRSVLLTGQVGISLALLLVASVLVAGFVRGLTLDPGFARKDMLLMSIGHPKTSIEPSSPFFRRLLDDVQRAPGVRGVSCASRAPLGFFGGGAAGRVFLPKDHPGDPGVSVPNCVVGDGYFRLIEVPVRQGRGFTPADNGSGRRVAVISQAMAMRFWPGKNPIGQTIHLDDRNAPETEVVGVVGDVMSHRIGVTNEPFFYLPLAQNPRRELTLMVDAPATAGLALQVRQIIRSVEPEIVILESTTLDDNRRLALLPNQVAAGLLGAFGLLALLLAAIGLYGVVSYTVKQRTQEIGIRLAIGAQPSQILGLAMRRG